MSVLRQGDSRIVFCNAAPGRSSPSTSATANSTGNYVRTSGSQLSSAPISVLPTQPPLGAPFDVVVADLSFISLRTVAPALMLLGNIESDYILLVKPQFEAGRTAVGKGGIMRDHAARLRAVTETIEGLSHVGLGAVDVGPSPIHGAKGNREVVGWFRHGPATVDPVQVKEAAS